MDLQEYFSRDLYSLGLVVLFFLFFVTVDCIRLDSLEVRMHPRGKVLFIFHSIIDYFE